MAPRKAKTAAVAPRGRAPAAATEPRVARQDAQPAAGGSPNRLLREAAWSRMFGRVESKKPFAR